jgi:phage gpG-like protein
MAITFELIDHTDECIDAKNAAVDRALEMIGLQAEGYAKMLCPVGTPKSTGIEGYHGGTLRNSITHTTEQDGGTVSAVVGTNVEYAA